MSKLIGNPPVLLAISTILILISIVLAGALIMFNYERNSDIALQTADERMTDLAELVDERLLRILRPLRSVTDISAVNPILVDDPHNLPGAAFNHLSTLLLQFPQIYSLFIGYSDGSFFQIYHLEETDTRLREALQAPPDTVFAIRKINRRKGQVKVLDAWLNVDIAGNPVSPPRAVLETYDPRQRPWFVEAKDKDSTVSVGPYRFAHSQEIGFTVSKSFHGKFSGVLGVDITMANISSFLREQSLAQHGLIVVVNSTGEIIAHPDEGVLKLASSNSDNSITLPHLSDLDDPLAKKLAAIIERDDINRSVNVGIHGEDHVGRVQVLDKTADGAVLLGMLVPSGIFTETIERVGRQSLYVSIILVICVIPIIVLLARIIVKPLHEIGAETTKIREFALEEPVAVNSRIREVRDLSASIGKMKSGIKNFSIYVPKSLVQQMIKTGAEPKLGGKRQQVTVLFTDVARFTDISESLDAEALMRRMSDYLEELTGALVNTHGRATIDKYIGDAIMALWNAPETDPDHIVNACRCTLLAHAANHRLNQKWQDQGITPFVTRFGLHTGEAVVGNVGSSDRMNYTAIGATVNVAARLEALNKVYGTEILVSDAIVDGLDDRFVTRSLDVVRPKGVTQPIRIHELLGAFDLDELSDEHPQTDWLERWEEAFQFHLARDWPAAITAFESLAKQRPDDTVAHIHLERAQSYQKSPPDEDWDGVVTFQNK